MADAARISGACLNAGDNPDGEREAAFSSVAGRIPRRLRDRKTFHIALLDGSRRRALQRDRS